MQPFANEYFARKSLTSLILCEICPYLHESTDFVPRKPLLRRRRGEERTGMQLLVTENFMCKSLTARILRENSPYLRESTDFVQRKTVRVNSPARRKTGRMDSRTLRFRHAIGIARKCRCQGEGCSGVEQSVGDVIDRFIELRRAMGADQHRQIREQSEDGH